MSATVPRVGTSVPIGSSVGRVVSLDPTTDRTATIVTYRTDEGFNSYVVEGKPWRFSRSLGRLVPAGWRP